MSVCGAEVIARPIAARSVRSRLPTVFDFGEWASEMASQKNPDGTISFITIVPGFNGLQFVAGERTLTLRDAQHEYVLAAQ